MNCQVEGFRDGSLGFRVLGFRGLGLGARGLGPSNKGLFKEV